MDNLTFEPRFQLFDLFSGAGNVGKTWSLGSIKLDLVPTSIKLHHMLVCLRQANGYTVAAYDWLNGEEMNFLTPAGFSLLLMHQMGTCRVPASPQHIMAEPVILGWPYGSYSTRSLTA